MAVELQAKEYEDIDVSAAALFRSVSLPKEMSAFNFDGEIRLPRKAKSVQGLVEIDTSKQDDEADYDDNGDEDEDSSDDESDDVEDDQEDQGDDYYDALREKCLKEGIRNPFWSGFIFDSSVHPIFGQPYERLSSTSIVVNFDNVDDYIDYSSGDEIVPPQTPALAGLWRVRARGDQVKSCEASFRRSAECALREYNRQEGVDYEFVKAHGSHLTSPPESEPDKDCLGKHMNFFARLKGSTDSSPDYFFASVNTQQVHCCKLIHDPTMVTIQHCEHTKCLECDQWTYRKKEFRKRN